jgi:hypothetical protein
MKIDVVNHGLVYETVVTDTPELVIDTSAVGQFYYAFAAVNDFGYSDWTSPWVRVVINP